MKTKKNYLYDGLIILLIIVLVYIVYYYQNNNENFENGLLDPPRSFDINKFIRVTKIDPDNVLLNTHIKDQQNQIKEFRDKINLTKSKANTKANTQTDELIYRYNECMKNITKCKPNYNNLPKVLNPLINIFKNLENKECITPDEKNIIIKNHTDKIKQFLDSNDSTSSNFSINDLIQDTATKLSASLLS